MNGLKINYRIAILVIFSIAMGYMESAVVVYLRRIFYPDGFAFPLQPIENSLAVTEIFRETATLIMLVSIGIITGRTNTERFGFFLMAFAIWDIFYYIFLYALIGWPDSLLTWDILFLIPVTWAGPVLGPVINSLTMMALALLISYFTSKNKVTRFNRTEGWLLVAGSMVLIFSYIKTYLGFMLDKFSPAEFFNPAKTAEVMKYAGDFVPQRFPWWIYISGQLILIAALGFFWKRNKTGG